MEEVPGNIKKFCDECREKTRMRFVERDDEYLVYECTVCDSRYEFLEEDLKGNIEEMV